MNAVLAAEGIGKSFRGREVLKAASLWALPGQIVALLGRNGSGKSTLMKIAVGWMSADYGSVRWRGNTRRRPRLARLARDGLLYSPQDTMLSANFTVEAHLDAVARRFRRHRLDEAIDELGLGGLLDRSPKRLSGGERQRVALAVAMIRDPACLVIDEPFTRLSPMDQGLFARVLRAFAARGMAVVTSGHDVPELLAVSNAILWVTAGTTHWLGTPEEARGHHQFRQEYLGPKALSASLPPEQES